MSMEGCAKFFRVVLVIINVLFFIIGVFMLSFGAALKANPIGLFNLFTDTFKDQSVQNALSGATDGIGIFMVVVGCIVAAIAIWGIVAAVLGNKPMLIIYAVVVTLVLGAEIALIIVAVLYPTVASVTLMSNFTRDDVYYYNESAILPPLSGIGRFTYLLQNKFDCCGFRIFTEYEGLSLDNRKPNCSSPAFASFCNNGITVPASCCKKTVTNQAFFYKKSDFKDLDQCLAGNKNFINDVGCLDAFYKSSSAITIAIAAVTMGIMVLLIVMASCAAHTKKYAKV